MKEANDVFAALIAHGYDPIEIIRYRPSDVLLLPAVRYAHIESRTEETTSAVPELLDWDDLPAEAFLPSPQSSDPGV